MIVSAALLAAGTKHVLINWQVAAVVATALTGALTLVWNAMRDRRRSTVDVIDKAITGLDELVDALQLERVSLRDEVSSLRHEVSGYLRKEQSLVREISGLQLNVLRLEGRIDTLMLTLRQHDIPPPV